MFIGHFAIGLAAKKWAPSASLGIGFLACQLLDLIWPALTILGIESVRVAPGITAFTPLDFTHYPFSHGLFMTMIWSILMAGALYLWKRNTHLAVTMGLVVLSHWVLDFITHRPDLPLLFGEPKVGLGLWNVVSATLVIEGLMLAVGIFLYTRVTRRTTLGAKLAFWSLIVFLLVIYGANAFGPPPPLDASPSMISGPAFAMWLLVAWTYAADRLATR